ncbi:GNAT family N-acetyltransferase [Cellulosimicrobium terreum]|nr:GNAT family N-acetyltransferase [Cellulosimicrobium terreum]
MTLDVRVPDDAGAVAHPGGPVVVALVANDDAAAAALFARQQAELAERYGEPDDSAFDTSGLLAVLVAHDDGAPVACVALRDVSGAPDGRGGNHPASTGEVKRLYVLPEHRGRGRARVVMRAAHEQATAAGLRLLVLETGTRQPESVDLYLDLGYTPIASYGHYAGDPLSRCFALELDRRDAPADRPGTGATSGRAPATRPSGGLQVRAAAWDDPVAARLRREMHETSSIVLYPELVAGFDAAGGFDVVDTRLGRDVAATFVAWRGNEPVGCASLRRADAGARAAHGEAFEVKKVFVRECARRGGAARRLMDAVEADARRRGADALLLETGIRQPGAIRLYRALGFRAVRPFSPYDDDRLGIALCFAKPLA